jgi:hypothetical protein
MLMRTVVESSNESARLRVEGLLVARWVEEPKKSCFMHALNDGIQLVLDLGDLSFVNATQIELLKGLRSRCVCEPFAFGGQLAQNRDAIWQRYIPARGSQTNAAGGCGDEGGTGLVKWKYLLASMRRMDWHFDVQIG